MGVGQGCCMTVVHSLNVGKAKPTSGDVGKGVCGGGGGSFEPPYPRGQGGVRGWRTMRALRCDAAGDGHCRSMAKGTGIPAQPTQVPPPPPQRALWGAE